MRSITAVEIGADTCALASTSVRGADQYVSAAETLDPAAFPGIDAFTLALQQTRRALKLPRRCRAVVWGLPDGATRKDPVVAPLIEPLTRAGFRVARVVTPCNALGALARLRTSRTGGAMCWLGINRNGVAIIVIRPGKLLYSHSFAWDSNVGASGSQARLLQRYSLVAFLAPEVRRALAAAKQNGTTVDGIVTCGNLPDLRSLTMPLIEELDIEVETLDSLEGLQMKPELADKLSEVAPAIRLACAGAFARETRSLDEGKRRRVRRTVRATSVLRIAAVLAVIAGAGYWWYWRTTSAPAPASRVSPVSKARPAPVPAPNSGVARNTPPPPATTAAPNAAPPAVTTPVQKPEAKPVVTTPPPNQAAATAPAPTPPSPARGAPPPVTPMTQTLAKNPPAAIPAPPKNAPPVPQPQTKNPPAVTPAAPETLPASPAQTTNPPAVALRSVPPPGQQGAPRPAAPAAGSGMAKSPVTADKPDASSAGRSPARQVPEPGPMPELLKDPVPKVTAILMAADRRLATVGDDGQIIAVGDTIGRRVVVAIDDRTVVLREPSGVQIRVALGGRVVGVERGIREP